MLKTIHASAPLRMNDIGGWTDTWFSGEGNVLNMAVGPPVEVDIRVDSQSRKRPDRVCFHALDYGDSFRVDPDEPDYSIHPLLHGALDSLPVPEGLDLDITIRSFLPAGSSLGTSASVCVALLGALSALSPESRSEEDIAYLALRVETEKLGLQSGIQDQLCAAFGGISFIHMNSYPEAEVTRLTLDRTLRGELVRRLCLVYLGSAHSSSAIHQQVIASLEKGGPGFAQLKVLRDLAEEAKRSLLASDLARFGGVMVRNNEAQRGLHPGLISEEADRVIRIAAKYDALGWKVNGAGGQGGSLTILGCVSRDKREKMIREIDSLKQGIRRLPAVLTSEGLRVHVEEAR